MPNETTELYVEMMSITRYGQVLASVMGFAFISILVTLSYYGKIRIRIRRWASALLVGLVLIGATVGGGRFMQSYVGNPLTDKYLTLDLSSDVTEGVTATILTDEAVTKKIVDPVIPTVKHIQASGEIRVGYNAEIIPFSYRNNSGQLVGFDIAYAYQLARDLGVKLKLVPFFWKSLIEELDANKFDIAMSGIYVTDTRLQQFEISLPYYQSKLALIVKANEINSYLNRELILEKADLKIGIFEDPLMRAMTKRLLPQAEVIILSSYDTLPDHPDIDAAIWTLEQAKAWAERETAYAAVVPQDLGGALPIGYLMPKGAKEFRAFIDYWLKLQSINGFEKRMTEKWLDRKYRPKKASRPGLLKELLGQKN
jgi:ABC-type amino acid transport substrate-binding protein